MGGEVIYIRQGGITMKRICKFLATGFEFGMIRGAPGTYGTAIGVGIYLLLRSLPLFSYIVFCVGFIFLSVWITAMALPLFQKEDPPEIVIDEIAGILVAMTAVPFTWLNVGLGFVLFRLFDITKPFPVGLIDKKVKGAWGIVLDDVAAGVYAWIVLYFTSQYIY